MTNRTPHASFENKTKIVRWGMDLRYQSAILPTNANVTRLENEIVGSVHPSSEREAPLSCYPPEPDFLVRSRLRPNEVIKKSDDFVQLRAKHVVHPVTKRWGEVQWSDHHLFDKTNRYGREQLAQN